MMDSEHTAVDGAGQSPHATRRMTAGTAVAILLAGALFGFFGGFLQAYFVSVAGFEVPVGLILALATLVAGLRALVHMFDSRLAAIPFLVGWAVTSVALALPGPGGDIVIGANTKAVVYLFGGVVLGTACANVPARLRPAAEASS